MRFLLILLPAVASSLLSPQAFAIVGGAYADSSRPIASSTVGVVSYNEGETTGSFCTGSIIANRYVLTAAHCLDPSRSKTKIIFSQELRSPTAFYVLAAQKISHPAFDRAKSLTWDYDVALLRFEEDLPANYRKIAMPGQKQYQKLGIDYQATFFAAGFGDRRYEDESEFRLREAPLDIAQLEYRRNQADFYQNPTGGICGGDSGGPIFVVFKNQPLLVGVISRSDGSDIRPDTCGTDSSATLIGTSVIQEWIRTVTLKD